MTNLILANSINALGYHMYMSLPPFTLVATRMKGVGFFNPQPGNLMWIYNLGCRPTYHQSTLCYS